ncbi:hypothetical protein [Nocardioides donggukensis]|uniref:Uncharacterized protein n=1 Tax=Nocardioides donggukensis TaxID=2774019 RepID=A0A927K7X4_9ACTN|nr:hypothetical protein [Nocardioides donggukensis]MBD8869426.1 hypothetical protein [Nocardioides donggukensis]
MASPLPLDSGRMAWWLSAWLAGEVPPDDLLSGVVGEDAAHDVAGLDGAGLTPLVLALGGLRSRGARSAGLALPVAGDPVGLGGPPAFNAAALEAGEAVVLAGADLGLVPTRAGAGVVWQLMPAARRPLADLGEADRGLRSALPTTATALAGLDVARWRPEVADELMNLRHRSGVAAPPGTPPLAVELADRAIQALAIVELALEDDGGAVTSHEIAAREAALRPLAGAGRRALVAACSPEVWPPA